jgi:putative transposase
MPMKVEEIETLLSSLGLTQAGIEYCRRVRSSEPSRAVGSHGMRNTPWRYASQKMGCAISGESTNEEEFFVLCEYDPGVREYWEQPEQVSLTFKDHRGCSQRAPYTPDVLVVRNEAVQIVQVKPQETCEQLVEKKPCRWAIVDGRYQDKAASEYFGAFGMVHIVVTEEDLPRIRCENYKLLMQARRSAPPVDEERLRERAIECLRHDGALTLSELSNHLGCSDLTTLLRMIDARSIVALLDKQRLANPDGAWVALDGKLLEAMLSMQSEYFPAQSVSGISHALAPSVKQAASMVIRLEELALPPSPKRARTLRRWKKKLKINGGCVLALVPQIHRRGRRQRRISEHDLRLIRQAINEILLVSSPSGKASAYRSYMRLHVECYGGQASINGGPIRHATFPTFLAEIARLAPEAVALKQGGQRAANAAAAPVDPLVRMLTPQRAFERAHIDHYLVDQHIVTLVTGKKTYLKRAWLTVMIDQATGVVLAISLSFRSPSRFSCACVMRDCVRRHGRLPETIVVDNGSDFQSVYFEVLLAFYGLHKHDRPSGAPRFGGPIESTFRSIKEELLRCLRGNTVSDVRGRAISVSHRGEAEACWEIGRVYDAYATYFFRIFNARVRARRFMTPDAQFSRSLEQFSCSGIVVKYDESFFVRTAIPTEEKLTIDAQRGVRHLDRWFWNPELALAPPRTKVEPLEEPWNDKCVYVSLNNKWLPCFHGDVVPSSDGSVNRMLESIIALESGDARTEAMTHQRLALEQHTEGCRAQERDEKKRDSQRAEKTSKRPSATPLSKADPSSIPFETYEATWNER